MGIVVEFCHARSSTDASRARTSAVSPDSLAREVASTERHHRSGILSRCHHLETWAGEAPTSAAHSSRVGQSSTTSRKEPKRSFMDDVLGQIVLERKHKLSHDTQKNPAQIVLMDKDAEKRFNLVLAARVRAARIGISGDPKNPRFTQEKLAQLLRINQGTYKNYEKSRPMKHYLIATFCDLCGIKVESLFAPIQAPDVSKTPPNAPAAISVAKRGHPRKRRIAT